MTDYKQDALRLAGQLSAAQAVMKDMNDALKEAMSHDWIRFDYGYRTKADKQCRLALSSYNQYIEGLDVPTPQSATVAALGSWVPASKIDSPCSAWVVGGEYDHFNGWDYGKVKMKRPRIAVASGGGGKIYWNTADGDDCWPKYAMIIQVPEPPSAATEPSEAPNA